MRWDDIRRRWIFAFEDRLAEMREEDARLLYPSPPKTQEEIDAREAERVGRGLP